MSEVSQQVVGKLGEVAGSQRYKCSIHVSFFCFGPTWIPRMLVRTLEITKAKKTTTYKQRNRKSEFLQESAHIGGGEVWT